MRGIMRVPTHRPLLLLLLLLLFLCLALLDTGIPAWIRSAPQGKKKERNHFDSGRYIDGVEKKRASRPL